MNGPDGDNRPGLRRLSARLERNRFDRGAPLGHLLHTRSGGGDEVGEPRSLAVNWGGRAEAGKLRLDFIEAQGDVANGPHDRPPRRPGC